MGVTVAQDPVSRAKTLLYRVEVDRGLSFPVAQALLAAAQEPVDNTTLPVAEAAAAAPDPASSSADASVNAQPRREQHSGFHRCLPVACREASSDCASLVRILKRHVVMDVCIAPCGIAAL